MDLSNPTAMSDNLIDFTDPTPVVGSQGFEVALQNFLCPKMIVLEEFSDELPRNLRMEPLPKLHSAPCWPDARLQETPVQSGQLLGPSASRGPAGDAASGRGSVLPVKTHNSGFLVFSSLRCSSPNLPSPLAGSSPHQQ